MANRRSPYPERIPSVMRLLSRGFTGRCPACGQTAIAKNWVSVVPRCTNCGLVFDRIEGQFAGYVGMNTIVSFAVLLLSLVISLILTYPDYPVLPLILWNSLVAIVFPIFFLPISRTLWTALDIAMRPLEAHEVDWTKVYASVGRDPATAPVPPDQEEENT